MLDDGSLIDGEQFEGIEPVIDLTPTSWYYADTGEMVLDTDLAQRLEKLYQAAIGSAPVLFFG